MERGRSGGGSSQLWKVVVLQQVRREGGPASPVIFRFRALRSRSEGEHRHHTQVGIPHRVISLQRSKACGHKETSLPKHRCVVLVPLQLHLVDLVVVLNADAPDDGQSIAPQEEGCASIYIYDAVFDLLDGSKEHRLGG